MPKVLYLTDSLSNGGAQRQLALLVKYLPQKWERRVWSLDEGPFAQIIRDEGICVDVRERAWRFDISPAFGLWRAVAGWRPDVVHSWGWMSSVAAGLACKCLGIPLVDGTVRVGMVNPRRGLALRWGRQWATRVVANSQAGISAWGIGPGKGRVVYNGFDPERLIHCTRENHRLEDPFVVVMTGRMVAEKDFGAFLAAARKLMAKNGQDWHFIAVGDGPNRSALMSEVEDLIEQGGVSFPEPGMEVLGIVGQAHVGVLMSHPVLHAEGCSNSIMEYMACGLPVVCSDGGGNQEVVIQGQTGFLVPAGDSYALVERLKYLRENREEALHMGEAGRQRILREFSVETMVQRMVSVYEELLF